MTAEVAFLIELGDTAHPYYVCRDIRDGKMVLTLDPYRAGRFNYERDAHAWAQEVDCRDYRVVEHAFDSDGEL